MSYEFFIAKRYLRTKRKIGFISLITYISIAGVAIGVAALIIVLSVMNGFEEELRSRFIGVDAHIQINNKENSGLTEYARIIDDLKNTPHVVASSPFIREKGLIRSRQSSAGIYVKGIEPETAVLATDIGKNINFGALKLGPVKTTSKRSMSGIVLGFNLADKLVVTIGDTVTIMSFSGITRMGQTPMYRQFKVTGYFETGLYEYDDNYAYISIEQAQRLFKLGQKVTGIEIRTDSQNKADNIAGKINQVLPEPYQAKSWFNINPNLFAAMQFEKWAAFIILSLIILVAAFNIASTMIMMTMEKTREIGILKSMGASSKSIRRIFTFEGLFVGIVGTTLGWSVGYGFCWAQQTFHFFSLPSIYIINWLPIVMKWSDFTIIGSAAILITFIATSYPAIAAAKLDPITALRYE